MGTRADVLYRGRVLYKLLHGIGVAIVVQVVRVTGGALRLPSEDLLEHIGIVILIALVCRFVLLHDIVDIRKL